MLMLILILIFIFIFISSTAQIKKRQRRPKRQSTSMDGAPFRTQVGNSFVPFPDQKKRKIRSQVESELKGGTEAPQQHTLVVSIPTHVLPESQHKPASDSFCKLTKFLQAICLKLCSMFCCLERQKQHLKQSNNGLQQTLEFAHTRLCRETPAIEQRIR